jgi:hypothetical protein
MGRLRNDPSLPAIAWSAAGVVGGFGCLLLAWLGSSTQLFAVLQTPWLASGGLIGLALIGVSATLLGLHLRRRALAQELVMFAEAERLARQLRGRWRP